MIVVAGIGRSTYGRSDSIFLLSSVSALPRLMPFPSRILQDHPAINPACYLGKLYAQWMERRHISTLANTYIRLWQGETHRRLWI